MEGLDKKRALIQGERLARGGKEQEPGWFRNWKW